MSNKNSYDRMVQSYPKDNSSHGFIQWKGTDVCMDIHCKCGKHLHADAEFLYFVTCGHCGTVYRVGNCVMLMELTEEEIKSEDIHNDGRNHVLRDDD